MSSKEKNGEGVHSHADTVLGTSVSAESVFDLLKLNSTSISTRQWKRIVAYSLVQLYPRNTPILPFIAQLKAQLGAIDILPDQLYSVRRIGHRWQAIVSWASRDCDQPLTGILVVLDGSSRWERPTDSIWQAAFDALPNKLEIVRRAQSKNREIDHTIKKLKNLFTFVNHPSHTEVNEVVPSQGNTSGAVTIAVSPDLMATDSVDAEPLIILLSFFANQEVSVDLLCRGTSPRKRWTDDGEISYVDPATLGLSDVLIQTCSAEILTKTLFKIDSAITWKSATTFSLTKEQRDRTLKLVPSSLYPFWSLQALILACRSVPWKYLEFCDASLFLTHIRYTLEEARRYFEFEDMAPVVRVEIALNLLESSRFSLIEWKQFAVDQAKQLTNGLDNSYTSSYLAQRQCLLHRLSGKTDLAFSALMNSFPHQSNRRLHASYGHTIIQRALNHIQLDQLDKAIATLATWRPGSTPLSAMEQVVLFRQQLIMGKILRYQGHFTASLQSLQISQGIAKTSQDTIFREDASDLVCNLADTFLELDDPPEAESRLRDAIERRLPSQGALIIALAECIFAQRRFVEVDNTLQPVFESDIKLTKVDELRLTILQAKLSHVQSQFPEAFRYWTQALGILRRLYVSSGRTTRIILLSQCHVLHHQGLFEVENRTRSHLDALDECAERNGAICWISGLRHWQHYLEYN